MRPPPSAWPLAKLSEYGFFTGPLADQTPVDGVVPYDVIAPLWADYAVKQRFLVVPKGETATLTDADDWTFPTNTIVIKTFRIPVDRRNPAKGSQPVETRLLIKTSTGWEAHVYVYDADGKDADLTIAGATPVIPTIDATGKHIQQTYIVPDVNMCLQCHKRADGVHLLGVITLQLNHDVDEGSGMLNQLTYLASQGILQNPPNGLPSYPAPFDPTTGSVEERARAYLGGNCSHCHRPDGASGVSGVDLLASEMTPSLFGVCKSPAAYTDPNGLLFDIVPGDEAHSIMPSRMDFPDSVGSFGEQQEIKTKMPPVPNLLPDLQGVALIEEWITGLTPPGCPQP